LVFFDVKLTLIAMIQIVIFSLILGFIPLIMLFFKNYDNNKISGVYPFVILVFIASLYESIFTLYLKVNVTNWFMVYDVLAFGSIHYFFFKLLKNQMKSLFLVVILIFTLIFCFLFHDLSAYSSLNYLVKNSILNIFQSIYILGFTILWFRKIFNEFEEDNLFRNPNFYFVSGLNVCYSGTVLLYLLSHYVHVNDPKAFNDFWILNIGLNIFLRSLLIVGIWKARVK
jgi:hypothetical protein